MKRQRLRTLVVTGAAGLFLALGGLALEAPSLEASSCGGPGEYLCKENTSCAGILWFRQCTTTYDYWSGF